MTQYRRKKSLRERVAARKAGRSEFEGNVTEPPWRNKLRWAGSFFQTIALVLMLFEIYRLFGRGFRDVNYVLITIYSGAFFIGRFIQIGLSITKNLSKQ